MTFGVVGPANRTRLAAFLAAILAYGCSAPPERPAPALRETAVARGSYLANGIAKCFWCHSPQTPTDPAVPRPELLGSGDVLDETTPVIAPNLTPDPETGLGKWTDQEITRAIREGIGRDGHRLRGDHPAAYYSVMTDDDAAAVVAYLRSLRPIRHVLPRSAQQKSYGETVQRPVAPAKGDFPNAESRGAYLVHLGECVGCHTTTDQGGAPRRSMAFGGGRRFVESRKGFGYELSPDPAFTGAPDPAIEPGGRIVTSANLTQDPSGIPYYTPDLFIQTLRTGKVAGVRQLSSAMPWVYFRHLTDEDLHAIFAYLKKRGLVRHHVNNTDPPKLCEVCGRRHGLGAENHRALSDVTEERGLIRAAMAAGGCAHTEDIFLRLGFSLEELQYTDRCWAEAQKQIVPQAMLKNDCAAVGSIPGIYPMGSDPEKRFVYHCWMDAGLRDLDSCIGMTEVGEKASIPHIVRVLRRNRPMRIHGSERLAIIDTAGACMDAFAQIRGLSKAQVRASAPSWGGTWVEWARQP